MSAMDESTDEERISPDQNEPNNEEQIPLDHDSDGNFFYYKRSTINCINNVKQQLPIHWIVSLMMKVIQLNGVKT